MKRLLLYFIRLYQKTLSFDHGALGRIFPDVRFCKFSPSCSQYSYEAIEKYGVFKGVAMGVVRIMKCGPWTPAGTYDPVK